MAILTFNVLKYTINLKSKKNFCTLHSALCTLHSALCPLLIAYSPFPETNLKNNFVAFLAVCLNPNGCGYDLSWLLAIDIITFI